MLKQISNSYNLPEGYDFSDKIKEAMKNYYDNNRHLGYSRMKWVEHLFEMAKGDIAAEEIMKYKEAVELGRSDFVPLITNALLSGTTLFTRQLGDLSVNIAAGSNAAPRNMIDKMEQVAQYSGTRSVFAVFLNTSSAQSFNVYSQIGRAHV